MADTFQVVRWTLALSCPLRVDGAVSDPVKAFACTAQARTYFEASSRSTRGLDVQGDICVTACELVQTPERQAIGDALRYPCSGFVVSQEFANVGGADALTALCRACPANATPEGLAGCAGVLWEDPESTGLQAQLEQIISRLELQAEVAEVFPKMELWWFSFWPRSPLSPQALLLLRRILAEKLQEDKERSRAGSQHHFQSLETFVEALRRAQEHQLSLHVAMGVPGHTDFGYYIVFPHCPNCKAEARIKRWQRHYPTEPYDCPVCATRYVPAEMASTLTDNMELPDLRDLIGRVQFPNFAKSYLKQQGLGDLEAAKIVFATEQREAERQRTIAEARRRESCRQVYVKQVLFAGLHPESDEPVSLNECDSQLFSADEFRTLLLRCHANGVKLSFMRHASAHEAGDRSVSQVVNKPQQLFDQWRRDGCNERFGASYLVPEKLLNSFKAEP
jgi:hypothetical protein